MTEILRALLGFAFNQGLNRIEAQCLAENKTSQALLIKLGFTKEGVLRQKMFIKRKYRDIIVFGLLKKEHEVLKEEDYETDH